MHGRTDRPQGIVVLSLLAFVSLFFSAFVAITLHELAHAVTGHLAGLNIRRLQLVGRQIGYWPDFAYNDQASDKPEENSA